MAQYGSAAGKAGEDAITPIKPATEFTKIKAAAIPDITLTSAHRKNSNRGLKKIPPPTPVRPDRKPRPAPAISNIARCGRPATGPDGLRAERNERQAA